MFCQTKAIVCHALALLLILAIGVVHCSRGTLLPWYSAVLAVLCPEFTSGVEAVITGYMKISATQIGV